MTREEAIKFLSNTKVYVNGESREVQEKLFSLGFQWQYYGKQIVNTDMPFLFAWNDMNICYSNDMKYFVKSEFKEITVNDILNIAIDKPKCRPFKEAQECFEEMSKHEPFGWVKYGEKFIFIPAIVGDRITILTDYEVRCLNFRECFVEMTFIDDTPFGIKEEEES